MFAKRTGAIITEQLVQRIYGMPGDSINEWMIFEKNGMIFLSFKFDMRKWGQ